MSENETSDWISSKDEPLRRDIPILIAVKGEEMPKVVKWCEEYKNDISGYYDENFEYYIDEKNILYWMPAPLMPKD